MTESVSGGGSALVEATGAGASVCPAPGTVRANRTLPVLDRLLHAGWEFDFFQAVWLLERYAAADRQAIGGRGPVDNEALRLRPHIALGFPPTDVRRITAHGTPGSSDERYQIDVTFMGLYGVSTPLPLHYAVRILRSCWQEEPGDTDDVAGAVPGPSVPSTDVPEQDAVRSFLDVLHHRVLSLFYRAWTKYRYHMTFEAGGRDRITDYLRSLIGCPPGYDEEDLGVSPVRMIRYAGLLTQRPRSALGLEGMLCDYWDDIPIEVQQFVGRWVTLHADDLNRIGTNNCRLGMDLTIGEQVFDLSGKFEIVVGPVDWDTYQTFLPDGERFAQTRAVAHLYCLDRLSFQLNVKLRGADVPETRLGCGPDAGRLGFTSWSRTQPSEDVSVVFDESSLVAPGVGSRGEEDGTDANC